MREPESCALGMGSKDGQHLTMLDYGVGQIWHPLRNELDAVSPIALRNDMALTNAERQARYRERIKQLAAKGVMSPAQAQLLSDVRRHMREWNRSIAAFAEGRMRMYAGNIETTTEHVAMLCGLIVQNEALLKQYDPDNLTSDGNVEIGEVTPQESSGVLPGRWVTYSLDARGRAVKLRLYDVETAARSDASVRDRHVGIIADDMWSISPLSE